MPEILDKLIIFLCCTILYLLEPTYGLNIIPIIISLTLSSLNSYWERADFRILSFITCVKNYNPENGIGIRNILDRVEALKGNVNINIENGFKIFITIPKEPSK